MSNNGLDNRVILSDGSVGYDDGTGSVRVKFGLSALNTLGRKLCGVVAAFRPVILQYFGDNPQIVALINLIDLLCPLIDDVAQALSDDTGDPTAMSSYEQLPASLRQIADALDGGA